MTQKTLIEVLGEDSGSIDGVLSALDELRGELLTGRRDDWENLTLEQFLGAMRAWLETMGPRIDGRPSWKFIEAMLRAAKIYE